VRRVLLVMTAAAALASPAPALAASTHAAVPCRDRIYNEWYATGKISTTYPPACYRDALKHIPTDAQVYSSLGSDIKRALQLALTRKTSTDPSRIPSAVGTGTVSRASNVTKNPRSSATTTGPLVPGHRPPAHVAQPAAATGSGGSSGLPLPILVLGGVAIALAAAGAIGAGVRHYRGR
jgi:hypothetical protein